MNEHVSDAELKDAVRRLAPGVDTSTFCRELGERCAEKKQSRYRGRRLRLVAIGAAVVVALAAVSAGLVTGLSHLRGTQSVIVFTDAPTTDAPSLSSTTTTMGQGPRFAWGEEAVLDGRTIKVEQPVEVRDETVEVPTGSHAPSVRLVAYSLVTITNTGSEPLTYAAQEFFLMGKSSGVDGRLGSRRKDAGWTRGLACRDASARRVGRGDGVLRPFTRRPPGQGAVRNKGLDGKRSYLDERMAGLMAVSDRLSRPRRTIIETRLPEPGAGGPYARLLGE